MASQRSTDAERAREEQRVLGRLLALYDEQRRVYQRVLELSRRQGEIVRAGGPLADVQRVLAEKKRCLDLVARLEHGERESKAAWEQQRERWSAAGRARLHATLSDVTELIEDILACEEQNDRELISMTQVVG